MSKKLNDDEGRAALAALIGQAVATQQQEREEIEAEERNREAAEEQIARHRRQGWHRSADALVQENINLMPAMKHKAVWEALLQVSLIAGRKIRLQFAKNAPHVAARLLMMERSGNFAIGERYRLGLLAVASSGTWDQDINRMVTLELNCGWNAEDFANTLARDIEAVKVL